MPEADILDQVRVFRAPLATATLDAHDRIRALIVDRARLDAGASANLTRLTGHDQDDALDLRDMPTVDPVTSGLPPRSFSDDNAAAVIELPGAAPRPPATRFARLVAVAAAILVVVLAVGVVVRARADQHGPIEQPVTVASPPVLPSVITSPSDLARLLGAQPDQPLGPGEFDYTRTERGENAESTDITTNQSVTLLVRETRERWAPATGPGRDLRGPRDARPLDDPGATPQTFAPRGSDEPLLAATAFSGLSYAELRGLPADPVALRAALVAVPSRTGTTRVGLVEFVLDLLAEPSTPPSVRQGLVALLSEEGLDEVGPGGDRNGRPGVNFTIPAHDGSGPWTVTFDAANGHVLGWQYTEPTTGQTNRYTEYLDQNVARDTTSH